LFASLASPAPSCDSRCRSEQCASLTQEAYH
jgi:hypothetical protein